MVMVQREALIVEDDSAIREVLRDLLEDAGYTVREAADGAEALAILRTSPRGLLVLLDNLLPTLNGTDVLASLERDGAAMAPAESAAPASLQHAYILLTASPQRITPELTERLARLGVPVITKPFDLAAFSVAVEQAGQQLYGVI